MNYSNNDEYYSNIIRIVSLALTSFLSVKISFTPETPKPQIRNIFGYALVGTSLVEALNENAVVTSA